MRQIKWGILAPGKIAQVFAKTLVEIDTAKCHSVCSRSIDRATEFAKENGFAHSYDDINKFLNDAELDVVYIASPHHLHYSQSITCLKAGKAVLCEKPLAVNSSQAREIIQAAQANNTFFMEAVWTRFMPIYAEVRNWIDAGKIGNVKMLKASFGFQFDQDPEHRLYNSSVAGGATLDMGIYPITLSHWLFKQAPAQVRAVGHIGATGVDEQVSIAIKYPGGEVAQLGSSIAVNTDHDAWIYGTRGKIRLHSQFWCSEAASLYLDCDAGARGANPESGLEPSHHLRIAHTISGYEGEIYAVHQSLEKNELENANMPWQSSIEVMEIMDQIREQIGLVYPFEK